MKTRRWTALSLTGLVGAVALLAVALTLLPPQAAQSAGQATVVSITFDDTYVDTVPALDAMKAKGIPGTMYVNSQRIGFNANYMTRAQLKGYADAGFEVGGHTLNHEDLTTLPADVAKANICQDRANLVNLGYKPTSFAYPFGGEDVNIQQMVRECGYNSARITSDLRSPTSCLKCATAEMIPPVNPYAIRTPATARSTFTLADYQSMVTQAENDKGGWVPLVFHHVCDTCGGNSITLANFTAFLDWLKDRPTSTTVKTVDSVMGGAVVPIGDVDPVPDDDLVIIGSRQHTLNGINAYRCSGCLIEYTRVAGATTGANAFGTEVSVVGGVVTAVQNGVGNMAIPAGTGNYVLSGHGESATWLKSWAKVGTSVTVHGADAPPPPPPPAAPSCPSGQVTVGAQTHVVSGTDVARKAGFLVVYTPAFGDATGTNEFGFEATVVGGKITRVNDALGNMPIPDDGCVLSGHGESRTWLKTFAVVGATVR
jgi:peptidoglycan/xylan/chitin deacetylase (PgdA/CDA1 family)